MQLPTQCVLHITAGDGGSVPALTPCGGRPFLAWLMREYLRFGFNDFVFLADPALEAALKAFCLTLPDLLPWEPGLRLALAPTSATETPQAALSAVGDLLDPICLFAPAHVLFDGNLARFVSWSALWRSPGGRLICTGSDEDAETGIRVLTADALESAADLPARPLAGELFDLTAPGGRTRADAELPVRLHRPAVFFDRDGVLNVDYDMVSTVERFAWMDGAIPALRAVNDAGLHAFIVTNQGGVAHGAYPESDVSILHAHMRNEARKAGAGFDDVRYCPFHPKAEVETYRGDSDWRKPKPGMILDLIEKWQVEPEGSLMIGDKPTDMQAAENAGIPGHLFTGGNIYDALKPLLPARRR